MAQQLFNNPNGARGATAVNISFAELYQIVREKLDYFHPERSDPDAFCQDMCVRIEKRMGIFPNLPEVAKTNDDAGATRGLVPPTTAAEAFMKANDASKVVAGRVLDAVTRGGAYTLENGQTFKLTAEDARSLPNDYPKWL